MVAPSVKAEMSQFSATMYCLRRNSVPCVTVLAADKAATRVLTRVDLHPGEALIWDNRLWHGREGEVGERVLIRFWSTCVPVRERALVLDLRPVT